MSSGWKCPKVAEKLPDEEKRHELHGPWIWYVVHRLGFSEIGGEKWKSHAEACTTTAHACIGHLKVEMGMALLIL